jgi:two-component system response regulator YesN
MYKTLIVDDTEIYLMELERLDVWGAGSDFVIAGKARNGVEALERLREDRFDLVITDIRMPKLDGIGLLKEIKEANLCDCVALVSEHSEFEYAQRGLVLGAFDYLVKPVNKSGMQDLLERTGAYLERISTGSFYYPKAEEESILSLLNTNTAAVPKIFLDTAEALVRLADNDDLPTADLIAKFYGNILYAVFEKYPWLSLYTQAGKYEIAFRSAQVLSPHDYYEALSALIEFVRGFVFADIPNLLKDICSHILENPEACVSLQSAANLFRVNNTYLSNLFKQKTGMRFNEYLTGVKVARAKYYLEYTDKKVSEISYDLGYADSDYFNRLFKKYTGATPSSYRKNFHIA